MKEQEKNLGYLLNKAARLTRWELNNKLSDLGLTAAQWAVIKDIQLHEKETDQYQYLTAAAIAQRLNNDRPTMTGIIQRLIKNEWVFRRVNPVDGRSQIVLLTDKARALIPKMEQLSEETMQVAMKGFTPHETAVLTQALLRIIENFTEAL